MGRTLVQRRGAAPRGGAAATTPVDGLGVAYQTSGNAELHHHTLVFIHSGGADACLWRRQLPYFSHACYCIAPDLTGHGRSEGNGADSVPAYAAFLSRFLDALAIRRPVVLVGHGLGGMIALHLALTDPARAQALVLVATGSRLRVRSEVLTALGRGEPLDDLVRGLFAPATPSEVLREQVRLWHMARPEVRHSDLLACNRYDCTGQVEAVRLPTLVVGGETDPMTPPRGMRSLHQRIAGSQLALIPEAGHFVMVEQPEAFNGKLGAFLDSL